MPADAPVAAEAAAAPATAEAQPGGAGRIDDRPQDFEAMWAEARTKGADETLAIGADGPVKDPVTGQFIKQEKPKAEPAAKDAKDTKEAKAEPVDGGTLAKARKMAADGDVEDAIALALGLEADELGNVQLKSPHFKALVRREKAARESVQLAYQEANARVAEVRQAAQNLIPAANAQVALEKGDYDECIRQLSRGRMTLEGFLRGVAGMQTRPAADPRTSAETEQLKQEVQRMRTEREQEKLAQRTAAEEQQTTAYKTDLRGSIEGMGGVFGALAKKPEFVEKVFRVQQRHWRKGVTLPAEEAAELVFEKDYGDVVQATSTRDPRDNGAATRAPRANGAPPAAAGARAPGANGAGGRPRTGTTNLSHTQAAEALPAIDTSRYNPETFHSNQAKIWDEIERHVSQSR